MFFLDKNTDLTTTILKKFIQSFVTSELPRLNKLKNYYDGKQDILMKYYEDRNKPCNKTVVNYCSGIVDNFNGGINYKITIPSFNKSYLINNTQVVYDNDNLELQNENNAKRTTILALSEIRNAV